VGGLCADLPYSFACDIFDPTAPWSTIQSRLTEIVGKDLAELQVAALEKASTGETDLPLSSNRLSTEVAYLAHEQRRGPIESYNGMLRVLAEHIDGQDKIPFYRKMASILDTKYFPYLLYLPVIEETLPGHKTGLRILNDLGPTGFMLINLTKRPGRYDKLPEDASPAVLAVHDMLHGDNKARVFSRTAAAVSGSPVLNLELYLKILEVRLAIYSKYLTLYKHFDDKALLDAVWFLLDHESDFIYSPSHRAVADRLNLDGNSKSVTQQGAGLIDRWVRELADPNDVGAAFVGTGRTITAPEIQKVLQAIEAALL
jgi:hypothetical protein